jgi:glycyl-tRNA synthetase
MSATNLDDLVALCKRRGFIYQSSSIYGGLQGFFDYGPLGVELKNNIKNLWWQDNVLMRDDVYGIDSSIILNQAVTNYSGHADTFTDNLIDCLNCKKRFRDDAVIENQCPYCQKKELSSKRAFNLMMKTNLGPTGETYGILRPETAQGIFINYKNICDSFSPKLPFGIAQIGKAFRNEITPRNFIFRMREFEQMELEYFIDPKDEDAMFQYWVEQRVQWWKKIGVTNIKTYNQSPSELAHYSKATTDILFQFPHGMEELEGIANRTDFDLGSHTQQQDMLNIKANVKQNNESTTSLCYSNPQTKFVPYIIESSAGLDRAVLAVLTQAYHEEAVENGTRVVLKLLPKLAPIKVAVIPLAKNNHEIVKCARDVFDKLKQRGILPIALEDGGNIGKCYRKHDEIGTPIAITIDFETLENETVTVRDRDTMTQQRVKIEDLHVYMQIQ